MKLCDLFWRGTSGGEGGGYGRSMGLGRGTSGGEGGGYGPNIGLGGSLGL